ncbi:hypothetical protein AURDEDRAFT_174045 [Auricularia subglabra TFB-10046 SS5]|nr:hypothetical protein AURDEDRAFT_174045 [Auricularia subglabra TFB-10046 SS5]
MLGYSKELFKLDLEKMKRKEKGEKLDKKRKAAGKDKAPKKARAPKKDKAPPKKKSLKGKERASTPEERVTPEEEDGVVPPPPPPPVQPVPPLPLPNPPKAPLEVEPNPPVPPLSPKKPPSAAPALSDPPAPDNDDDNETDEWPSEYEGPFASDTDIAKLTADETPLEPKSSIMVKLGDESDQFVGITLPDALCDKKHHFAWAFKRAMEGIPMVENDAKLLKFALRVWPKPKVMRKEMKEAAIEAITLF